MAKVDRNKLLEQAQKHIQDGNLAKAIEVYELIHKAFPQDVNTVTRLAGLYQRLGKHNEAVKLYIQVGDQYFKGGFYQKAIAAYKQALVLTPKEPVLHEQIAICHQKVGIKSSAMEHFHQAAQLYMQAGNYAKAGELFKQLVDLEPDRVDFKGQYGEILFHLGKTEEALNIFRGLVEILKLEQKFEELARFYERILRLNPQDTETAKELARVYIRLSLPPKALKILKDLFDHGHVDAELFDLLGKTYVLMGKHDHAVRAFLKMIEHLDPTRDKDQIEKTYKRILEIDPTNEVALRALSREEAPEVVAAPEEGEPQGEVVEVVDLPEEYAGAKGLVPEKAAVADTLKKDEFFDLLQQASVFLRFGVQDKALANLNRILSKRPDHIPALKKRVEILRKHDPSQAVRDLVHLAELHEALGQGEEAQKFIEEAKRLKPDHPALKAYLGLVDFDLEKELGDVLSPSAPSEETGILGVEEAEEEAVELEEAEPEAPEEVTVVGPQIARDEETLSDPFVRTLAEISEEVGEVLEAGEKVGTSPSPEAPDLLLGGTGLDAELEQLQFFVDTGLFEEARRLLDDLKGRFGDHPRLQKIENDLLLKTGAKAPAPPSSAPAAGFDIEDLVKDLEGELGGVLEEVAPGSEDVPSFEEMFSQFKEGVKKQLGEDPHAHYDLGIAYLEMGLLDDAIQEFEISARSQERFVESREMLAEAYRRKGEPAQAARFLEEALKFPALKDTAFLNIHYNLALVYEDLGNFKKALEHFRTVLEKDRNYRDIVDQLKRMKEKIQTLRSRDAASSP